MEGWVGDDVAEGIDRGKHSRWDGKECQELLLYILGS